MSPAVATSYGELRQRGLEAVNDGRLEAALELFDRAFGWAREAGDPILADRALCNRGAVEIELGQGRAAVPRLRQILVANADDENCFLASYNVGRYYELERNPKKGLFYARVARDRASQVGSGDWIASSHNLMGNLLLSDSFFEEAYAEYERALALMPSAPSVRRALILDNMGYCLIVKGQYARGFSLLYESLRTLRRHRVRRGQAYPHLALCFAHLEVGRYHQARRHGEAALALAEEIGDPISIKNALYLLGQLASLRGDAADARARFTHLQRAYYPDVAHLPDFLLAVDIRPLVNLRA